MNESVRGVKRPNRIASLYPLTKFYMAIAFLIVAIVMPGLIAKLVCFVLVNLVAVVSGVWPTFIRRLLASVGALFIILLLIQVFFGAGEKIIFTFWIFSAKWEGLMFALNLGFVLLCVGGCLIWFFAVTREKDFVLSLEKVGMNPKAAYVILSTLQMVPVLKKRSETIMNAQRARGTETEGNLFVRARVFVPTIVPLVLSSISGIEERALTLEARGFSVEGMRTHLDDLEWSSTDRVAVVVVTVVFVAAIAGGITLWVI